MHFQLDIDSPEALFGFLFALVFVALIYLLRPPRRNETHNHLDLSRSQGSSVNLDQSKKTRVSINTNVTLNQVAIPPERPTSRSQANRPSGRANSDDGFSIFFAIGGLLLLVGFQYLRHFELVTYISRTLCFGTAFTAAFLALLYGNQQEWEFDEILGGYLLASIASVLSAGFLLHAQDLISSDLVQAATAHKKGAVDFFLNGHSHRELAYVLASMMAAIGACLIACGSFFSILRALALSWLDAGEPSFLLRLAIRATNRFRPAPFALLATILLVGIAFVLYFWLPNALSH